LPGPIHHISFCVDFALLYKSFVVSCIKEDYFLCNFRDRNEKSELFLQGAYTSLGEIPSSNNNWRPHSGGKVPEDAFHAGWDGHKRKAIYICSAKINNDQIPGCIIPADASSKILYNETERNITSQYYVLCGNKESFHWLLQLMEARKFQPTWF